MHPRTQRERTLDSRIRDTAEQRTSEASMRAARLGCHTAPSAPENDDEWSREIILTSLGRFMHRRDALELATALGSTLLLMEALGTDQHWVGRAFGEEHCPPLLEDLDQMCVEFETWAVDHAGPRHDHPKRQPHQAALFDMRKEAA